MIDLHFSADPGTPDDDCSPDEPCSIGEGPCTEDDTCENKLRCGNKNCGNFPGNSNNEANCCYDPYRPGNIHLLFPNLLFFHHSGDGDQFVFDVFTVLGQQMERTLDWFDEGEEEMTITCCGENGGEERKKCGGHNATNDNGETLRRPSCKDICGVGTQYIDSFSPISILTYFLFSDQISVCL